MPKALITGAGGQVGSALVAEAPAGWEVAPCDSTVLDVTRREAVHDAVDRERPSIIFHTAAYTAVDAAETDAARAEAVNVTGAANVADAARRIGARLVHLSTDFVFDGAHGKPYRPDDAPNPLSVYGRTKLESERAVARACSDAALIVRTAWVYSASGRNFVLTMLRLLRERETVGVVADQIGTPTWARSLAEALWRGAARADMLGVHHWTDAGVASWFDFAVAIREEALALGLLTRAATVQPLRTEDYPTPARRPAYSVLDKTVTWTALGLPARHWRVSLRLMLQELARA